MANEQHHEHYMRRCFQLAVKGLGYAAPNPLVGAVIVHNHRIIGEGYHQQYGGPHAEVNAINSVAEEDRHLLPDSTIYVSLEPCSHYGKTPPCADLIVNNRIGRVVMANTDPNPLVASKGIMKLLKGGCKVEKEVLAEEGHYLNRRFFTAMEKERPYVILKWAQTADGFFAKDNKEQSWITGAYAAEAVHRWRSEEQAILIGTQTALVDNPQLTNRRWPGRPQPTRVVIDKKLSLPKTHHLFDGEQRTIVINEQEEGEQGATRFVKVVFDDTVARQVLEQLYRLDIHSVIVEGGVATLQAFIDAELWDEARILTGTQRWGKGMAAPALTGHTLSHEQLGKDELTILQPTL